MRVIPLIFTREFPVIFCEIWGRSYKYFWDIEPITFPRNIFILQNGLVYDYRNPELIKELQDNFYSRSSGSSKYFYGLYRLWLRQYRKIEQYWSRPYLTKPQLYDLAALIQKFWPAMFASLFIPLDRRFPKKDRELMIKLRTEIGDLADQAAQAINKTSRHYFPKLGELASLLTLDDFNKARVNKQKLQRRSARKLVMVDDRFVTTNELKKLQDRYHFNLEKLLIKRNKKLFTGQTAYRGTAEGRARLVLKRADMTRFNKGEILISAMTVPDFIPAMKKAAAIVTDEGGLTCHAAIVSRELGIPCVVGTKIATKVFKDGDNVQVDATKGIVKKLN